MTTLDFELLFQSTPGAYLVLAPDLTTVAVNDAYLQATLTTRAEILGRPIDDVFPSNPDAPAANGLTNLRASLARVLQHRRPDRMKVQKHDIRRPAADGGQLEARYWRQLNSPVLGANGEVLYILSAIEDVTDQVRLEERGTAHDYALRQLLVRSEQRFEQLLDAAPDAIVVVGPDARIDFVNEQTEQLFQYTREELVGAELSALIPERLRERHAIHVARFFASPTARPMGTGIELIGQRKDGSEFPIEVSLSPLHSERGTTVSAAIRDITQRKRIEAEAKVNAARFANAIESMQDAFAMYDGEDRLVRCNAAYRALLAPVVKEPLVGKTREQLVEAWLDLMDPTQRPSEPPLREQWLRGRMEDPSRTFELRTREQRSLRVTERPTGQGDLVEVVWDLTDDERRADELRLARAEAEAASAAKSEFLSSMSHELRTPMNAILGFAQLLARDTKEPLSARHRERVSQILRGGKHLLRLIDDVLDLARIEAGRVSVSAEPVAFSDVFSEVGGTLEALARDRDIRVEVEPIAPDAPRVIADRVRLIQILTNFGSNAIKYNRPGGRVTLRVAPRGEMVRLMVEDSGFGIPHDQQAKLFQPFQRAGQEAGPIEGTGIGLLITKRLAELMGGSVGFNSTPSVGSCFWLELPLLREAAASTPIDARAAAEQLSGAEHGLVVYVEDNPANIAFMTDVFQSFEGYHLVTARTAEEGVTLTRSLRPQVVLMDINLPGMSGTQALAELRRTPDTSTIPVIALTAAASERDRRYGLQAGFFRYLTKPINIDELASSLQAAITDRPSVTP
ncbi:MAG: PAS domain S-box protein [Polyangiales bacterium]